MTLVGTFHSIWVISSYFAFLAAIALELETRFSKFAYWTCVDYPFSGEWVASAAAAECLTVAAAAAADVDVAVAVGAAVVVAVDVAAAVAVAVEALVVEVVEVE